MALSQNSQDDIAAEIDAIIQTGSKSKNNFLISHFAEIVVDKKASSVSTISGEFAIVQQKKFLDGTTEDEDVTRHQFRVDEHDELTIEKYDLNHPLLRSVMKTLHDAIIGIKSVAASSTMRFKLDENQGFECKERKIMVICETGKNKGVRDTANHMIFLGQANSHVDTGTWLNVINREKCKKWAFLEVERRINNDETVIVSGDFQHWYDLMPLIVISKTAHVDLVIGRTAGRKLAIGNVLDVNSVFEHFLESDIDLSIFEDDPYSAIEYFRQIDHSISSLVIFPSILHKFLSSE